MIKRVLSCLFACLFFLLASSQEYTVTYVKGTIMQGNNVLQVGQKVNAENNLVAKQKNALLRLISPGKGAVVLTFQTGVAVAAPISSGKQPEWYSCTIGKYLHALNAQATLTTRGTEETDWFDYFTGFPDSADGRLMVMEDEKISLRNSRVPVDKQTALYACVYRGDDSTLVKLDITKDDSLMLGAALFKISRGRDAAIRWKLKMHAINGNEKIYEDVSGILTSVVLKKEDVTEMLGGFAYLPEASARLQAFETFLLFNYGKFNQSAIRKLL